MRHLYFLLTATFILTFLTNSLGQRIDYNSDSGFDIGFGVGGSYQRSDVRNSFGTGYDFRFGHSFHQNPESFFGVDWRFRFLAGQNRAFDDRINTDGTYTNVKYTHFNYDFELVLTLNRLLNKTGIIISGFAGAGIAHSRTKFDHYDDFLGTSTTPYDYSTINLTGSDSREQIYQDLLFLSDNNFETKGINNASITPTAGFYLGYQLTKHFSLGVEHKTNFFLKESNHIVGSNIDGKININSPIDRNNYTSLIFKWDIGRGSNKSNYTQSNNSNNNIIPCNRPIINFSVQEISSNNATHELVGTVQNIAYKSNITVKLNGQINNNFQYNSTTRRISAFYNLTPGEHTIAITAQNSCGRDAHVVSVYIEGPSVNPNPPCDLPIINVGLNEVRNINSTHELVGTVDNINFKSDISVKLDNRTIFNFQYSPTTNKISALFNLAPGEHTLDITAKNRCGTDTETFSVVVEDTKNDPVVVQGPKNNPVVVDEEEEVPCDIPEIRIALSEDNAANFTHKLTGSVSNVDSKTNISVRVDGRTNNAFQYVPRTNSLNARYNFTPGRHTISVTATTECGTDTETFSVVVEDTKNDPVVVQGPKNNPVVVDEEEEVPCDIPEIRIALSEDNNAANFTHKLTGSVSNVDSKTNISVRVDGRTNNAFQYVPRTNSLNARYNFTPGRHTISVTATTECGTDTETFSVVVEDTKNDPVVVQGPKNNPVVVKEPACGPRINPGNADWQFCLVTPRGTYNRANLANKNFRYSGKASSLYFKAIAGGGDATVNGKPYPLIPGQYYLFTGDINVTVSTSNPNSMGQWSVCIDSRSTPKHGVGNSRPVSPCEGSK